MECDIPDPNPFLVQWLLEQECRRMMQAKAEVAQAFYQARVAKRSSYLARSARVDTLIDGPTTKDRWCSRLLVEASYAASHEFGTGRTNPDRAQPGAHDLNTVLQRLANT